MKDNNTTLKTESPTFPAPELRNNRTHTTSAHPGVRSI